MPEILFEMPEQQLRIEERHESPPPGFVDLLSHLTSSPA
jgi:hypothetical protein